MSGDEDRDSKTEEPTEKRQSEAVEKGNVPFAREMTLFGSLLGICTALVLLGTWSVQQLAPLLGEMLDWAGSMRLDDREAVAHVLVIITTVCASATLPVFAVIAGGAIVTSVIQNVPSAAIDRIAPKVSRISPASGWARLFGKRGLIEFCKSCLKLVAVVTVAFGVLKSQSPGYLSALSAEPSALPATLKQSVLGILVALSILSLFFAIGDLMWSRFRWRRDLRMTRHEVKEEMRQAEGDPHIKARIRSIGRQRKSRNMLEKLPGATMVIANPTHFAVALRYSSTEGGAPTVIAKGVDFMALKIRERAESHAVPVVENKPLARALYDKVEIDQQIPPEFYRAVAEIIHFLHSRKRPQVIGRQG